MLGGYAKIISVLEKKCVCVCVGGSYAKIFCGREKKFWGGNSLHGCTYLHYIYLYSNSGKDLSYILFLFDTLIKCWGVGKSGYAKLFSTHVEYLSIMYSLSSFT